MKRSSGCSASSLDEANIAPSRAHTLPIKRFACDSPVVVSKRKSMPLVATRVLKTTRVFFPRFT
ncbi:MAG: hypothetical protein FJ095_16885 [Deltaproteobacteria bacterium]|nr:hypothetical protein [Deltaproteobacteria bacterium]